MSADTRASRLDQDIPARQNEITRRKLLKNGAVGVLLTNPAAKAAIGILGALGASTALESCATAPKPETEGAKAILPTIQTFSQIYHSKDVSSQDAAAILASAAIQDNGDITRIIDDYKSLSNTSTLSPLLNDTQTATLACIADTDQKTTTDVAATFNAIYTLLRSDTFTGPLGGSYFSDKINLAINATAMANMSTVNMSTLKETLSRIQNFAERGDDLDKSIIEAQTGAIALSLLLEPQTVGSDRLQPIMDMAKDYYKRTGVDAQGAAVLSLATIFAGGDKDQVMKTFKDFAVHYTDSTATTLTLASVIDGFSSQRIKEMFDYASSYYDDTVSITENQAVQLTLATAMKESTLPPFLQEAAQNLNIIVPILVWWFFFRP